MHPRFYITLAAVVGLAAAGCAGTSVTPGPFAANPPASQVMASGLGSTVQPARNFGTPPAIRREASTLRVNPDASFKRAMYIIDHSANEPIKILSNTYYRDLGSINDGGDPIAESIDKQGNLYVANLSAENVTEYAPGGTSPSFTYSDKMRFPRAITLDRHDNLYEVDSETLYSPYINEYFRGVNQVSQSCSIPDYIASGVAVDASGDVFVATLDGMYEFVGGLSGCNATYLNNLSNIHGMAIDSNNSLIIATEFYGLVAVVDPPYTNMNRWMDYSFYTPSSVSINKTNKLLYATDSGTNTILVFNYHSGQIVKVLNGSSYGIKEAQGVVDAPNAIY